MEEMVVMAMVMETTLRDGRDLTMVAAASFVVFLCRPLSERFGCLHTLYLV